MARRVMLYSGNLWLCLWAWTLMCVTTQETFCLCQPQRRRGWRSLCCSDVMWVLWGTASLCRQAMCKFCKCSACLGQVLSCPKRWTWKGKGAAISHSLGRNPGKTRETRLGSRGQAGESLGIDLLEVGLPLTTLSNKQSQFYNRSFWSLNLLLVYEK